MYYFVYMIYNDHIVLHTHIYLDFLEDSSVLRSWFDSILHHSVLSCTCSSAKAILSSQDADETYLLISLATAILHHSLGDQMAWSAGDRPYSYPQSLVNY